MILAVKAREIPYILLRLLQLFFAHVFVRQNAAGLLFKMRSSILSFEFLTKIEKTRAKDRPNGQKKPKNQASPSYLGHSHV